MLNSFRSWFLLSIHMDQNGHNEVKKKPNESRELNFHSNRTVSTLITFLITPVSQSFRALGLKSLWHLPLMPNLIIRNITYCWWINTLCKNETFRKFKTLKQMWKYLWNETYFTTTKKDQQRLLFCPCQENSWSLAVFYFIFCSKTIILWPRFVNTKPALVSSAI